MKDIFIIVLIFAAFIGFFVGFFDFEIHRYLECRTVFPTYFCLNYILR